jgi:PHP family Zn ribbon phosphoesterase
MKLAVDLHIHSALSPCAGDDMTPNNIVNMALIKGLDIIAITDHNSALNVPAIQKCAEGKGLVAIPGMEVETMEEVHLICLFPDIKKASVMQQHVYKTLPPYKNREDIFGLQPVYDGKDNILFHEERLLLTACGLSINDIFSAAEELNGVVIPAHIDRESHGIISNLGMIPEDLDIVYVEVTGEKGLKDLKQKGLLPDNYKILMSSDAHTLGDIFERINFIELEEKSADCLITCLKKR